jgi:hypothetical protein
MGLRSSFPKQTSGHLCGCVYEGQLLGGQERNVACSNVPEAVLRISFQNETFAPIRTIIHMRNNKFGGLQ